MKKSTQSKKVNELLHVLHEEHELSDHFRLYARAQHPSRRGSDRPALQLKRKAPGAHASPPRALWKTRTAGSHPDESFSRDPREDDRHHAFAREFLHEQIQETGLHRVQRQDQDQQVAADRCLARVDCKYFPFTGPHPSSAEKQDIRSTSKSNGSWVARAVILPQVMDSREKDCRCRRQF